MLGSDPPAIEDSAGGFPQAEEWGCCVFSKNED